MRVNNRWVEVLAAMSAGALVACCLWLAFVWGGIVAKQATLDTETQRNGTLLADIKADSAEAWEALAKAIETESRLRKLAEEIESVKKGAKK